MRRETLLKLIQKSEPAKVVFEETGSTSEQTGCEPVYSAVCPSCGMELISFTDESEMTYPFGEEENPEQIFKRQYVHHAYIGANNYCCRCGQRLDWGKYPKEKKEEL